MIHSIQFTSILNKEIPEIYTISESLETVLINLIRNSVDALENCKDKKILVQTYKKNNLVSIDVIDNGIGIPNQSRKDIFSPFYSTKSKGMGLGLWNCYQIVAEVLNGTIEFQSNPLIETIFTVNIPIQEKEKP